MKREKKEKLTGRQRLMRAMEMPVMSVGKSVRVSLYDNIRADIEGVQGIAEYSDSKVKFSTKKFLVTIIGSELKINEYSEEITVVEGFIHMISYEKAAVKV